MKVGDKVCLVDDEGVFTIKRIKDSRVLLADEHGFETSCLLSQLVPYISSHDFNLDIPIPRKEEKIKKNIKASENKEKTREIDLHIGHLVDFPDNLQPHQKLQKQLHIARTEIERARKDKVEKLILIHGKGKGVLKSEIYKLLESQEGIEYLEADIRKYRFGAVEIRFK